MRKYGKWVLTLGLMAALPGAVSAFPGSGPDAVTAKAAAKSANQKTAEDIASALRKARFQGQEVGIQFRNGVATISGSVTDAAQKELADKAIEKVPGVKSVKNELVVAGKTSKTAAPATAAAPRQAPPTRGPSGLPERQVVQAGGMQAPTRAPIQQVAFEDAAPAATAGGVSNQQVAEQIAAALTSAQLDGYDIEIRYQNGVAYLDGSVPTQMQKAAAHRACQMTPGVQQVQNNLVCTAEAAARGPAMDPRMNPAMGQQMPPQMQGQYRPAAYQADPNAPGVAPGAQVPPPGMPMPPQSGMPGGGNPQAIYNQPGLPDYAWPSYAQYPNYAAVTYPQQYSANAFPYIGPFYPYPQVPLGWRKASLEWDDGYWNLKFRSRTDKWWWFLSPNNW